MTVTFQVHRLNFKAGKNRFGRRHYRAQPDVVGLATSYRPRVQNYSKNFVHPLLHRRTQQLAVENP
jgi:hypothetical protein